MLSSHIHKYMSLIETHTVSELTYYIRTMLEEGIGSVVVTGEISNFKHHSSGHRYFTLKDSDAQITCVMWRSRTLGFQPQDGMKVVLTGRLTVYPQHGKYQIDCSSMRPDGVGDLHAAFEALKKKLSVLGWFDIERKKPIPSFPRTIGIATSKTGAALQDMLSTITRRYPLLDVVLRNTMVQGPTAAVDIAKAIKQLEKEEVDVIIIGRGGGSIEDLWCFNEETVAKAIVECSVPIISAVGHETDFTISDFVADFRAATPTAAAETVTPYTVREIIGTFTELQSGISSFISYAVSNLQDTVDSFLDGRAKERIIQRVHLADQRLDELEDRIRMAIKSSLQRTTEFIERTRKLTLLLISHNLEKTTARLAAFEQMIKISHPLTPLRRGFAIIEVGGTVLSSDSPIKPGQEITVVREHDRAKAKILSVTENDALTKD